MADTVGNRLGERSVFNYVSDQGLNFKIQLDRSVGLAAGNVIATNALLPDLRATQKRPLTPRYMLFALASDPSITKRVVIGEADNALFVSGSVAPVAINGVDWIPTARVGEARYTRPLSEPAT